MKRRFTMIDEAFECVICHQMIEPLEYTARDHCPHCLCSLHLDILPGDREADCHGILKPIRIEKFKDSFKIVYQCDKCGEIKKNKVAKDDNEEMIYTIARRQI